MTSQIMDKQIMDLSNSHTTDTANKSEFIDFMNRPPEKKDDDVVPSYGFMPIRPFVQWSTPPPPPATRSTNFDSTDGNAPLRTWNSFDSKTKASSGRNYNSLEPGKFILGKNHKPDNASLDASFVSEIERTVKKYTDSLMHAMDGVSDQLSDLETRARDLEHLVDDLKGSIENSHESTDGKLRQLENIFREVQTGVHAIRDKQEMVEVQLQMAKLHNPKVEQVESQTTAQTDSTHPGTSSHQQLSITQPPPTLPPNNAPPPPQQTFQPQIQLQNQFPQNFPTHDQPPQNPSKQYQIPPPQQPQHPPPLPQQHQFQPQYPQPPYPQPPTPSQPLPQPPLGHHTEETPYPPPSQTYPPAIRPSTSHPITGVPPLSSQQFYGPPPNVHEPPSRRPSLGYSGSFGPSSSHGEPYPYSSGSHMKMQQLSPIMGGQSGGSSYPQLPTARILPQAVPTTSGVGGGSGSGGSGNKVPIDDVVEKVTNMGFSREQVRATVQKLTENGQVVDLNVVLDKLMNDGDGQAPRDWFGR